LSASFGQSSPIFLSFVFRTILFKLQLKHDKWTVHLTEESRKDDEVSI
jgi:hypothetical protein